MRKAMLCILIMLLLCGPCGLGETYCVVAGGVAALMDDEGVRLVGEDVYTTGFPLIAGELFALGNVTPEGSSYVILTRTGERLTQETYDMIVSAQSVLLFRKDSLYGALSAEGEALIPAEYTQLATADGVHFLATRTDPYDDVPDQVWLVTAEEEPQQLEWRVEDGLGSFANGLLLYKDADTERYGFLDGLGASAIPALYDGADAFSNGLAKVCVKGAYGVIDTDGATRIPCTYAYIELGPHMILAVRDDGVLDVYDASTGEVLYRVEMPHTNAWLAGSYLVVSGEETTDIYAADGQIVYSCGPLAMVREGLDGDMILSDGLWGEECCWVLSGEGSAWERREQQLWPCGSLYVRAVFRAVAYISPELGEKRYSCDQDSCRLGLLDQAGEEVVPAEYLEISCVGEDRYLLIGEDRWSVVNGRGELLWSASRLR